MPYFLLAIVFSICTLVSVSSEGKQKDIQCLNKVNFSYLLPVVIILLGGIRWVTGYDWPNYYNFFSNHDTWSSFNNGEFEVLYTALNFICKKIVNSYTFFLFIFTALITFLEYKSISKLTVTYFGLTVYLLFCFTNGNILAVRQDLATAILFCSLPSIINHKKKEFFLITLTAVCVHNSAVIWFFAYLIYWHKSNRRKDILLLLFSFVMGAVIAKLFVPLVTFVVGFFPARFRFIQKIIVYLDMKDGLFSIKRIVLNLIKRLLVFPLFFYYEKKITKKCNWFSGVFSLYIFGTCIYFLFNMSASLRVFQRMSNYFVILEILLLPQVYGAMKIKNKRIMIVFLFLYGLLKLYKSVYTMPEASIPYYTIFNYVQRF